MMMMMTVTLMIMMMTKLMVMMTMKMMMAIALWAMMSFFVIMNQQQWPPWWPCLYLLPGQEWALPSNIAADQLGNPLCKLHVSKDRDLEHHHHHRHPHPHRHYHHNHHHHHHREEHQYHFDPCSSGGLVRSKSLSGLSCPATWSRTVEEVVLHKVDVMVMLRMRMLRMLKLYNLLVTMIWTLWLVGSKLYNW